MSADRRPYALVVEDEPIIRMDAAAMLEDLGYRSLEANNADQALDLLVRYEGQVTLLFTDVDMPGSRDGFELALAVSGLYPSISILVASGRYKPRPGDMPDGALFIGKPFSTQLVYERMKELLPKGGKPDLLKD